MNKEISSIGSDVGSQEDKEFVEESDEYKPTATILPTNMHSTLSPSHSDEISQLDVKEEEKGGEEEEEEEKGKSPVNTRKESSSKSKQIQAFNKKLRGKEKARLSKREIRLSKKRKLALYLEEIKEDEDDLHVNYTLNYVPKAINTSTRDAFNDILIHVQNPKHMYHEREGTFKQNYELEFYEGSKFVGKTGFQNHVVNTTEFTIISQTTYLLADQ